MLHQYTIYVCSLTKTKDGWVDTHTLTLIILSVEVMVYDSHILLSQLALLLYLHIDCGYLVWLRIKN